MVVLTILDDAAIARMVVRLLEGWGHTVVSVADPHGAGGALRRQSFDLILANRAFDDGGTSMAPLVQQYCPHVPLIAICAEGPECPTEGSFVWDRLHAPIEPVRLRELVHLAECHKKTLDENQRLREELARARATEAIAGPASSAERLRESVRCAAQCSANVLIRGEPGSGKEYLARAIHKAAASDPGPFVIAHCDELSPEDINPNSSPDSAGCSFVQRAHGGVLFLDEIADASSDCQEALLEMLDRRGRNRQEPDAFRVIASTACDVETEVQTGRFREDLFLKLNVLGITVPPLRERTEDLLPLAEELLRAYCLRHNRPQPKLPSGIAAALVSHNWPGNVRELSQVIERIVLLSDGDTIRADDIRTLGGINTPAEDSEPACRTGRREDAVVVLAAAAWSSLTLDEFNEQVICGLEKQYVCSILRSQQGRVNAAAARGRIPQRTFRRMLRRHNISPTEFRMARGRS